MTSKNDITGDDLKSKNNNDKYREGWDRIFKKEKEESTLDNADIGQSVESTDLKSVK